MKERARFVVTLAIAMGLAAAAARAQVFSILPEPPADPVAKGSVPGPRPTKRTVFLVDTAALARSLEAAPTQRFDAALSTYGLAVQLPHPDGGAKGALADCFVASSPVMEPALAAKFPDIRTFIVQSADRAATGRLELSPRGLTAMLRATGGSGTWMIDPWRSADPAHAVAYWLRDLPGGGDWTCETVEGAHGFGESDDGSPLPSTRGPGTQPLRTFRLAMACTGEFGLFHSQREGHAPNIADPLAVIVTMVGRANVVYEGDLAVHFNLVANNDLLVFTDPTTDPYASTCGGQSGTDCSFSHLNVNNTTINAVIGAANYDIGHVVTRVFGGVAGLGVVCSANKASGVSGIPRGGDIDPLSALVVIHEMGHQFGANHTFNGTRGRCAGNVSLSNAFEAGSGSSPMAYAGACPVGDAAPSDNIVQFADPFFHHTSIEAMTAQISLFTCQTLTTSENHLPTISLPVLNAWIPPGTPFVLEASASDTDGDALTYSWEQRDAGFSRPLTGIGSEDNGLGALLRLFPPVPEQARTFPQMADVLSGLATPGEQLPTTLNSTRHFRVIVRDNHPGVGSMTISPTVTLVVAAATSPFAVTSPSQGMIARSGAYDATWSVGGTNFTPILCSTVTLRLSLDDGTTFPILLGSFPNTGAAVITLPELESNRARVRVDANGKVFFAVSQPFILVRRCVADVDDGSSTGTTNAAVTVDDLVYFLALFADGNPAADIDDGTATGAPDESVSIHDLLYYLVRFEAGC